MHNALMLLPAVYMPYMAGEHGEGHFSCGMYIRVLITSRMELKL